MRLAKYIRLSDEDDDCRSGEKAESNSIGNQRALLDDFLTTRAEFALAEVLEFCDDGYTGRNFERPGVARLLALARGKEIDCVVVKDFSRFGRNYIDVGAYLEQIFPFCGVRFISVNDRYDSAEQEYGTAGNLEVGFKNFINDLYSRDLSQKAKTARIQYAKRGECIAADSFYGYRKSPENRRKLIIDQEAAEVVRFIFTLRCQKLGSKEIARALNERRIPTPIQHKRQLGTGAWLWKNRESDNSWGHEAVYRILKEERYTGKAIGHTRIMAEIRSGKQVRLPPEEWIVVSNAHPAIISEEIFRQANDPLRKPVRGAAPETKLFAGKIKCGACGLAMDYTPGRRPYYKCRRRGLGCSGETKIYVDDLEMAVWEAIRLQEKLTQDPERQAEQEQAERKKRRRRGKAREDAHKIRKGKLEARKMELFLSLEDGTVSSTEYTARNERLTAEICKTEKDAVRAELLSEAERGRGAENGGLDAPQSARAIPGLTRVVVERLIRKIKVYDGCGIEIEWNFVVPWEEAADIGRGGANKTYKSCFVGEWD